MKGRDLLVLKTQLKIRSSSEVQRLLDISASTWNRWVLQRPDEELPGHIALACAALLAGLAPYEPEPVDEDEFYYYGGSPAITLKHRDRETHEALVKEMLAIAAKSEN